MKPGVRSEPHTNPATVVCSIKERQYSGRKAEFNNKGENHINYNGRDEYENLSLVEFTQKKFFEHNANMTVRPGTGQISITPGVMK
jgi:hypothetical protein